MGVSNANPTVRAWEASLLEGLRALLETLMQQIVLLPNSVRHAFKA